MFSSDRDGGVPQLYRRPRTEQAARSECLSPTAMLPKSWRPKVNSSSIRADRPSSWGSCPLTEGVPHLFDSSKVVIPGFRPGLTEWPLAGVRVSRGGEARPGCSGMLEHLRAKLPGAWVWQGAISRNGGASPRWSRDGSEIFYYARDGWLMAVPVTSNGPALEVGAAVPLFEASLLGGPPPMKSFKQQYDVANDGRFLLNVPVEQVSDTVVHRRRQLDGRLAP